jgi:hypothetical protein
MENLKLVQIKTRSANLGVVKGLSIGIVGISLIMIWGFYAYTKGTGAVPTVSFSAAENTTFNSMKGNVTSGYDILGVTLVILPVAGILAVVSMFG